MRRRPGRIEFLAFPLGRKHEDGNIEVLAFYYPKDWREHATEKQVDLPGKWWLDALKVAAAGKMMPLGTCHSHCYHKGTTEFDEVQSLADMDTWDTIGAHQADIGKLQSKLAERHFNCLIATHV